MSDQPGGLGRVYIPDPRDRMFSMARVVGTMKPTTRHWKIGPVLDQGMTSQCVGFAWAQFLHSAPIMTRDRTLPRPEAIYNMAQTMDEWTGEAYEGTSVRGGAKALLSLGLIKSYVWADSMPTLKRFVSEIGPVVAGTDWFGGMDRTRGGFTIPEGRYRGGHAFLIIGWSESRRAFRCVNSWGEWGEGGRFWIDEADMQYLIFQANGEACSAVEVE